MTLQPRRSLPRCTGTGGRLVGSVLAASFHFPPRHANLPKKNRSTQVVAFPTDEEAQKAENVWSKGAPFKGRVTSMNPRAKKGPQLKRGSEAFLGFAKSLEAKKKKKNATGGKGGSSNAPGEGAEGGAGVLAGKPALARIVPPGTEVLLVVAPKQSELMVSVSPLLRWSGRAA